MYGVTQLMLLDIIDYRKRKRIVYNRHYGVFFRWLFLLLGEDDDEVLNAIICFENKKQIDLILNRITHKNIEMLPMCSTSVLAQIGMYGSDEHRNKILLAGEFDNEILENIACFGNDYHRSFILSHCRDTIDDEVIFQIRENQC